MRKEKANPATVHDVSGYTAAYEREDLQFPVYVTMLVGAALIAAGATKGITALGALGIVAFAYAVFNYPLLETGRPRIGAGQYGMFVEGLGIIAWRGIGGLDLVTVLTGSLIRHELHVTTRAPLESALIADWRKLTSVRSLMRLPWTYLGKARKGIRVPLDIMDQHPAAIHASLTRMWRSYRG